MGLGPERWIYRVNFDDPDWPQTPPYWACEDEASAVALLEKVHIPLKYRIDVGLAAHALYDGRDNTMWLILSDPDLDSDRAPHRVRVLRREAHNLCARFRPLSDVRPTL
jgi:hypothetical protein